MRKQLIPLIITLLFFMGNNCFAQTFGGGSGNSASDPYLISTKAHLIELANRVNGNGFTVNNFSGKYFKMMNDIDMSVSGTFNPIGNANNRTFRGNFNGDGHIIYNLTLSITNYVGLFGNILNATIENIGIDSTCSFTCPNHGSSRYYGGTLVAYSSNSNFYNCYSSAQITGNGDLWSIGGLIGASNQDTIKNCYSRSKIFHLPANGQFWNSNYGGIIGEVLNTNTFLILNSYSAPDTIPSGEAPGPGGRVGVLIGNDFTPNANRVVNTYYLKKEYYWADWSQMVDFMNSYIGIPKYIGEMRTEQFAVDLNACQTNTWRWANRDLTLNKGLPMLYWQGIGDTIGCTVSGGTPTEPYRIRYATDLIRLSNDVSEGANYSNSYFIVENDISFKTGSIDSSSFFNPIGNIEINTNSGNVGNNYSFQGYFNGNGHVISNLTLSTANSNNTNYVGLFGNTLNATIENIGIDNTCSFSCPSHNRGTYYGGGLVAYSTNSNFNSCYSNVILSSAGDRWCVGGLIGGSDKDTLNNCYSRSNISRSGGSSFWSSYYGGLIGRVITPSTFYLSNSYSAPVALPTGNTNNSGSLIGNIGGNNSRVVNSYYIAVNGTNNNTGTSKTLTQMRQEAFAVLLNPNSQCSLQVWEWTNGDYSINNGCLVLYWQEVGTPLPSAFLDGAGTINNPFLIRTVADMIKFSNCVNGGTPFTGMYFRLENNIVFNGSSDGFNPIGNVASRSFQGIFNGEGYVISNLTISSGAYVGLFGNISGAKIENLGIERFTITPAPNNGYAGALVGSANNSEINGCYSANSTISGNRQLFSSIYIGGLIGRLEGVSKINNSYSRSSLEAITADIFYTSYVGGLVANISGNSIISNSYSAPENLGSEGTRGAFFANGSVTTVNSYYDNANTNSNNIGLTSKSQAEMRSGCFVVSLNNSQNPIVWFKAKSQVNLGYPVLSWQKLSDGITPAGFEGNCLGYNTPFVGSNSSPYKVQYVKDLIYISNMVANDTTYNENGVKKYFQMLNDINFNNGIIDSSSLYNPIGDFSNNKPFSGNFSGYSDLNLDRYAIANYSFLDATKDNIGLFGYIKNATIQKLGISNVNIKARNNVGGLVGNVDAISTLDECFVYGYINGTENVGGLVGIATTGSGSISKSFTNTTIDAQTNVGGIVGKFNGGAINNSYSNSEIYSSTPENDYVGGIIGRAAAAPTLNKVYSACKIIRNGTNDKFGKIIGNNLGNVTSCYSRDSVFVNYSNSNTNPPGNAITIMNNDTLRDVSFVATLGSTYWKADYTDSINDGYPILKYQLQPAKLNSSGSWQTASNWVGSVLPKASQVVIIPNAKKLKIETSSSPMAAYIKVEKGGELNNTTNIKFFGEYNRELYAGKWNLIGLSTYNQTLASLYNYADTSFKTFVKEFDYITNNWSTTTTQGVNTKFEIGEGILVMPNYSLDDRLLIKSRIVSKGVLFNEQNYQVPNQTTLAGRFVSLANNYSANLTVTQNDPPISGNTAGLIQGRFIYVYDADSGKWNNNFNTNVRVTSIKTGEGFFIAASSTGGNFLFDKSQISNTSGAKNTIKSDLIYVKAIANDNVRESFLEFNEEADNAFDFEDGLMLFGNNYNSVEPFFTIPTPEINDSTLYLIKDAFSSLPYTTELDLRSQKSNEVTLNFSNIPSNIHVYLLDSLLNKAQYLNEEPNYELQVNEGDNAKRLYVLFSYYKEDINDFFKPEVAQEIKIWNYNNNLNIEGRDLIRYEIFDIMGNKLLVEDILDDRFKAQLDLGSGIYIVRAFSSSSSKAQKISISRK